MSINRQKNIIRNAYFKTCLKLLKTINQYGLLVCNFTGVNIKFSTQRQTKGRVNGSTALGSELQGGPTHTASGYVCMHAWPYHWSTLQIRAALQLLPCPVSLKRKEQKNQRGGGGGGGMQSIKRWCQLGMGRGRDRGLWRPMQLEPCQGCDWERVREAWVKTGLHMQVVCKLQQP